MTSLFTKRGNEIDSKEMLKADSHQELMDKVDSRLNRKYVKSSKIAWVWQIQDVFNKSGYEELTNGNLVGDYDELFKRLRFTIESKANWLEIKYKYTRLSYQDFEAELWKITYDAIEYYEQSGDIDTEFTLLETLELFWKTRIISFIKSCLFTVKHKGWYTSLPLADDFEEFWEDESPNQEDEYLYKETIQEMFNDIELTDEERNLLAVIYDYPSGSLREWGKELGINHPETVRRLFQTLRKKLAKYSVPLPAV